MVGWMGGWRVRSHVRIVLGDKLGMGEYGEIVDLGRSGRCNALCSVVFVITRISVCQVKISDPIKHNKV
jgi:hypothetical protein